MPLLDRFSHPPGHFRYREPKTGMAFGDEGVGSYDVAEALFRHRASNSRLFEASERTKEACELDVDNYTCKRLKNNAKWCQQIEKPPTQDQNAKSKAKKSASVEGCAGCGGRKKRA